MDIELAWLVLGSTERSIAGSCLENRQVSQGAHSSLDHAISSNEVYSRNYISSSRSSLPSKGVGKALVASHLYRGIVGRRPRISSAA